MRGVYLNKVVDTDKRIQSISNNFGTHYYVDGWNGLDSNDGKSWARAFLTMEYAFTKITSGDTIHLTGKITEQIVAPLGVFDITITGNSPGHPRQSTNNGAQAGYSAYWLYDVDNTVALLTLREQGWRIENICFQAPASTATTAAAILMVRAETTTYPDPSHVIIKDCYFAGGGNAVIDSGGVGFVTLENNTFYAQTGFSVQNIAGAGIAAPLMWVIKGNRFLGMTNGIYSAFSHAVITENVFTDGGTPNTTVVLNTAALGGGGNNFIIRNYFQTLTANFNTPDIVGNATDVWNNTSIDATFTSGGVSGLETGQPA
jgi:hypothetical protein